MIGINKDKALVRYNNLKSVIEKDLKFYFDETEDLSNKLNTILKLRDNELNNGYLSKLPKLIYYLTNVTKRKTLIKEIKLKHFNSKVNIGINHNGLGYERDYSSQLTPFEKKYYDDDNELINLLELLTNDEYSLEILNGINSKNKKQFVKICNELKKVDKKFFSKINLNKLSNNIVKVIEGYDYSYNKSRKDFQIIFDSSYLKLKDFEYNGFQLPSSVNTSLFKERNFKERNLKRFIDNSKNYQIGCFELFEQIIERKEHILEILNNIENQLIERNKQLSRLNKVLNELIIPFETLEKL